jgi:exonuclease V gamma subunit
MPIQVFFSNHTEELLEKLSQDLRLSWKQPLNPPFLVIPNQNLAKWIKLQLTDCWGISANIHCTYLESTLWDILYSKSKGAQKGGFSAKLLTGKDLQQLILEVFRHLKEGSFPEEMRLFQDFLSPVPSKRSKDIALSAQLAHLFLEYQYNRPEIVYHWPQRNFFTSPSNMVEQTTSHFQIEMERAQRKLYDLVFGHQGALEQYNQKTGTEHATLPMLYHRVKREGSWDDSHTKPEQTSLYLFGTSELSLFHRKVLYELGHEKHFHITLCMLNPCSTYWEDSFIGKKTSHWLTAKPPQEAISIANNSEELPPLPHSLDTHLLSSWGKVGRESVTLWSQATDYNFEYALSANAPSATYQYPQKQDEAQNLLPLLQDSILYRLSLEEILMEQGQTKEKVLQSEEQHPSLQIWEAPSIQREVESVHQAIRNLMENQGNEKENSTPLNLTDIAILVPNMDKYCDTIRFVFERYTYSSPGYIPFTLFQKVPSDTFFSHFQQAAQSYFDLMQGHLSRREVFLFLRNPLVQDTLKISSQQIAAWEQWALEQNVYQEYSAEGTYVEPYQSWAQGMRKTLLSQISCNTWSEYIPNQGTFFEASLEEMEIFFQIIDRLFWEKEEFQQFLNSPIHSETPWTYGVNKLNTHIRQWFASPEAASSSFGKIHSKEEQHAQKQFLANLKGLKKQDSMSLGSKKSYTLAQDFWELVQGCLSIPPLGTGPFLTNGVTISTLTPMKPIPFQVIFILGLNEGEFPGNTVPSSLDLRHTRRRIGDIDSKSRNQYLFLETLLSARRKLILSYIGRDRKKDQELQPSSVISDLEYTLRTIWSSTELNQELMLRHPISENPYMHIPSFSKEKRELLDFFPITPEEWEYGKRLHHVQQGFPKTFISEEIQRAHRSHRDITKQQTLKKAFHLPDVQQYIQNPMEYYLRNQLKIKSSTEQHTSNQEFLKEDLILQETPHLEPHFFPLQEIYDEFIAGELKVVFTRNSQNTYCLDSGKARFESLYQRLILTGSTSTSPYRDVHKNQMWKHTEPFRTTLIKWQKEYAGYTLIQGLSLGKGDGRTSHHEVSFAASTVHVNHHSINSEHDKENTFLSYECTLNGYLDFLLCPSEESSSDRPNLAVRFVQGTPKLKHTSSAILFYFASILQRELVERPFQVIVHGIDIKKELKGKKEFVYNSKFLSSPAYDLSSENKEFRSVLEQWFSLWCSQININSMYPSWHLPYIQAESHYYKEEVHKKTKKYVNLPKVLKLLDLLYGNLLSRQTS